MPKDLSDPVPAYSKGNYSKGNISLWLHKLVRGRVRLEQGSAGDTKKSTHMILAGSRPLNHTPGFGDELLTKTWFSHHLEQLVSESQLCSIPVQYFWDKSKHRC